MPLQLPPEAFRKDDTTPDSRFYQVPRFVTHIDDQVIAAITETYREILPVGGAVLDLMSSWVSHLPPELDYVVTGHGMNAEELAANPRLSDWWVQDLNADPVLPLEDASFDAACLCVSIQYLQDPVAVLTELRRVLRPGGPLVVSFSNRCFPTKAVAIWLALGGRDQARLVSAYLTEAGFDAVEIREPLPPGGRGDPLWMVIGRA
ncbi:methyltransferase domain-containing protein [Rubellimicrobium rubrum]|uniref:Methyltransferase domain-containing protein n=1 Tax=Rubellimicrobium rubrum TaxID=2585369 RepID=A0A5C4MXF4_9RHOB|nr:methyltransferase domain-containing protein [Rubellimicrobium rubrum]TNC50137.1 methyltransferase domain-containing protein [Rubellimicrobium rubrum]